MLDKILLPILNMSFNACFVIVFVLILRLFLKSTPKIFSYSLWSVVLFRLVSPFTFNSVLSLLPTKQNPIPVDIVTQEHPIIQTGLPFLNESINRGISQTLPYEIAPHIENPLQILVSTLGIVWGVGVVALLTYSIIRLLILKKHLCNATHLRDNIYLCDGINTAFVIGLFKPKIYLCESMSTYEQEYILLHERTHIKRGDHIIKIISFVTLCLHWFNPLVWIAFFLSAKDMEMSCDESVIKKLGYQVKKDYSVSLLKLATGKKIVGYSPLAFGEGNTKGRIKNVLNYKKPAFWMMIIIGLIVAVLGYMLISNPKSKAVDEMDSSEFMRELADSLLYEDGELSVTIPKKSPMGYSLADLSIRVNGVAPTRNGSVISFTAFENEDSLRHWKLGEEYTEQMFEDEIPIGARAEIKFSLLHISGQGVKQSISRESMKSEIELDSFIKSKTGNPLVFPAYNIENPHKLKLIEDLNNTAKFVVNGSFPEGWTVKRSELNDDEQTGDLYTPLNLHSRERFMGYIAFNTFEPSTKNVEQSEYYKAFYPKQLKSSTFSWGEYETVRTTDYSEVGIVYLKLLDDTLAVDDTDYDSLGIIAYDKTLKVYIAIEFTPWAVDQKTAHEIAKTISLNPTT